MRPRDLGTNLLQSAILIYLACRARKNEVNGAKKKTFETNILNFFLERASISNFYGATNENNSGKFV